MKTFTEWLETNHLNEGMPADWKPTEKLNPDPLLSALKKVRLGDVAGKMPYNGNFAGVNVIQTRFDLDNDEIEALKKAKLIIRDTEGFYNLKPSQQNLPSPKMPPPPVRV